jgi:cytochrome c553
MYLLDDQIVSMPYIHRLANVSLAIIALTSMAAHAGEFPSWAYPVNAPGAQPAAIDEVPRHVPDSSITFTQRQIGAIAVQPPDWHPDEHPPMTGIVGHSREPRVYACAYCHLPNGAGRPENASLAGLSANYIKAQVSAFREGHRPGSEPRRGPHTFMSAITREMTDAEIESSAAYFAALPHVAFTKVIESPTAPQTAVSGWMLKALPSTEPIGYRIIEVAQEFERFENRDSRTPYIAYVPVGSIARGAKLVAGESKGTQPCASCHGVGLRGLVDVPQIAGRSPSYLFRQLYDIREGKRTGTAELMKPVVTGLDDEDLVAIAAYLASQKP